MYGVIGEDRSDVETLKILIRSIAGDNSLSVRTKGYSTCSEMLTKGYKQLQLFEKLKCTRFIACYDSDRDDPAARREELIAKVFDKAGVSGECCALVPIQELESWILADIKAVTNIIKGWRPEKEVKQPELIKDPKEYLEKLSRENQRPKYSHATHNPAIAPFLDVKLIAERCPSFLPLERIVKEGKGNLDS